MTSDFRGVGWKFPVGLGADNQIDTARHEEAIRQSVWMILDTAPGERVMRPRFGCDIHDLVFEVNSAGTTGLINSHVRQALLQWEPRINVQTVEVVSDDSQPDQLLIEIEYLVRTTNNRFNLVYPFYVE